MRRAFCVLLATLLWLAVGPLASVRAEGLEFEAKPESLGDIPDPGFCFEFGDGLDVQFEVSGVESVEQVEVELTIEHDWVGELQPT